jgi:hypothetical protein
MKLSNYLFSREFVESARLDPKHFTRQRTLTLPTVLSFLLSAVQAAVQSERDQFFANLRNRADSVREVTAQAFSQARYKINALVFGEVNQELIRLAEEHLPFPRWKGLRVVATDGSDVRLTMMKDGVRSIVKGMAFGLYLPGIELFLDFRLHEPLSNLISNDRQLGASGEPGWAYPELCHHREVRAMAMNRIQFQPGLSMPEFAKRFGTESQCAAALEAARWPNGFSCPRCGGAGHCVLRGGSCKVFQCNACRHQTSLIAGTVFQGTKLPLTVWFLAIYLISQAKTGLSALALKRHLGVSYPTAWLIHHKLMRAMEQREERYVLEGQVQVDDAYLGGERTGGKVGRGSENKVPFVAAVSFSEEGHPLRAKLTLVPGFTLTAIAQWAKRNLAPGSTVLSDGLACFNAVIDAGCVHQPTVVAGRKPKDLPEFKWVNTVLGNLKTSLSGCYHALAFRKYGAQYLAAFAYRFNRRFDLRTLNARLLARRRSLLAPEFDTFRVPNA